MTLYNVMILIKSVLYKDKNTTTIRYFLKKTFSQKLITNFSPLYNNAEIQRERSSTKKKKKKKKKLKKKKG